MNHKILTNRRGTTLVETLIAVSLLSVVLVGTMMLMVTMLNIWQKGSSGTSANSYTSLGMRKLVLDIEEGRSAVMLDTWTDTDGTVYADRLQVTFPYYDSATHRYVKTEPGNVATYYLSQGAIWKSMGGSSTKLVDNVDSLRFVVVHGVLVRVNMKGSDPEHGAVSPNFLQQSFMLRNSS